MLKRPNLTLHEANWLFVFLLIGWGGLIGSGITALCIGAMAWNLGAFALGRLDLAVEREARVTATLFAAFFALMAFSNIINQPLDDTAKEMGKNLLFLGPILFYASLGRSSRAFISHAVRWGVISGAYGTFVLAVFQYTFMDMPRPEGFAGNPGPLSVIAAFLYCLCILIAAERAGLERILASGAIACAATIVILTGMRGAWPVLVAGALIPCVVYGRSVLVQHFKRMLAISIVLLAGFAVTSGNSVSVRVSNIAADLEQITSEGNFNNSIGYRLAMWETGLDLIQERPVFGHGSANTRELMQQRAQSLGYERVNFSHFHNFLITTGVHSGIVGLAALLAMMAVPLWMALGRRLRDDTAKFGFGMMLSLYATFTISGMTNIMLHHDIMDSLFVFGTAVSCFLVFRQDDDKGASPPHKPFGQIDGRVRIFSRRRWRPVPRP